MSISRFRITPTPSNTATNTPTMTPTQTVCPGICFSGTGTNPGAAGTVYAIAQDVFDPTKMTMVGLFSSVNGVSRVRMARLYTDGEVDTTFTPGTSFGLAPLEFVQQGDGKYVVVGSFTTFSGVSRNRIARINYNGTLDTSFVVGTGFTRTTYYAALDTGGKILICGLGNNQYSGTNVGVLCRLNTDGTLDTTFSNNAIPATSATVASKVVRNSDGTYYLGGNFSHAGRTNLIKLNSDGTYAAADPFNTSGVGFAGSVNDFEVQADGKLIVVGDMVSYNGVAMPRGIIRLNANGTRDTSFAMGGYSNYQYEVLLQGSKYISVGFSYTYSGIPCNNITRLNNDGTFDYTWNSGDFTASVFEDAIQHLYQITGATNDAGNIFCAGQFTSYDGILTNNIVKMDSNGFIKDCDPIPVSPTPTNTPTNTPTPSITASPTTTPSTTPTITPTTSPCINCYEYSFTASTSGLLTWLDCDGIMSDTFVNSGDTYQITCIGAREGSVSGTGTIVRGALCSSTCLTPTPTTTNTSTPTQTPSVSPTNTITPTQTQTPSVSPTNTTTPTNTPTITPTATCPSFTTQYLQVNLQSCHNFQLKLFDNPDFTGNANALCDVVVSGCAYGDQGTIYCGTETIASGDHTHNFSLQPVLLPGECVSAFTVNSITELCACYEVIYTPPPSATPTSTPTMTQTPSVSPTMTNTPTNTETPSSTPTQTATPSITPTNTPSPEPCDCSCWSLTFTPPLTPSDLQVRWRDCQTDTIITDDVLNLEQVDNGDGTLTANICVSNVGSYNTPICVLNGLEITCDPYTWIQGGQCCIPGDCSIPPTPSNTPTNTATPSSTPPEPSATPTNTITPTITSSPTSTQTCCAIEITTNNSLDVDITAVDVDGTAATYVGGQPLPNEPGNGTSLCSTITGTVDIRVSVFNSVPGQKITLCDSNGTCVCQNITGTGPSNYDWLDVVFNCSTPILIYAEDGSC